MTVRRIRPIAANPVLVKELRTRMRGARAYWIVGGYLALLGGVLLLVYYGHLSSWHAASESQGGYLPRTAEAGRTMFLTLLCTQAALIALIAPALTSGAIAGEREHHSYELLASSPLSAGAVVRGKLGATVVFIALLLFASLPLASVTFLFGGVSTDEVLTTFCILVASAVTYSAIGLCWSAALRRTAGATAGAYVTVAVLFLGTLLLGFFDYSSTPGPPLRSFNALTGALRGVEPEQLFRWAPPSWITGVVGNLLVGMLLGLLAAEQMESFTARRPALRRALATLAWAVGWTSVCGVIIGWDAYRSRAGGAYPATQAEKDLVPIFIWLIWLVPVVAPLFVAGEQPGRVRLWRALDPRAWFSDHLPGGLGLIAAWVGLVSGIVVGGCALVGAGASLAAAGFLPIALALAAAAVFGVGGVGAFWSAVRKSAWQARALTWVTLAVLALAARVMTGESLPGTTTTPIVELWRLAPMARVFAGTGLIGYLTAALVDRRRAATARSAAANALH
jgi:ABC-type transport system involved in multi-copper enzyme maturation permease subunit